METAGDAGTTAPASEDTYQQPKPWLVTVSLLAAFVVFVICSGALIYRGVTAADPRSVIVVIGSEKWKGAAITVEGDSLKKSLTAYIEDYNKFQVPFFVEQGKFKVHLTKGTYRETQEVELTQDNLLATWPLPASGPPPELP